MTVKELMSTNICFVKADADVSDAGDLHAIIPDWRTLNGQAVSDVQAPVSWHPQAFAWDELVPSRCGYVLALGNHTVC